MKSIKFVLIVICGLLLFACQNNEHSEAYKLHKQELLRIRKFSKQHKSIADETIIDTLLYFFDKEGTESDRLMAHFYYASYLRDAHVYNHAYEEFVNALTLVPAKKNETDEDIEQSIFSNLQGLSRRDRNYEVAMDWWEKAQKSGAYGMDHMCFLYYDKAANFLGCGQSDSCCVYQQKTYESLLLTKDWDENKRWCLDMLTANYALMGKTADFKKCYALLKKHPYNGEGANSSLRCGLFCAQNGQRDSADYFFRKALNASTEEALEAAIQLGISYRNRQEHDSVFAYYQQTVTFMDKLMEEHAESYTRELEVTSRIYQKELKVSEQRTYVLGLALICLLTILALAWTCRCIMAYRQRLKRIKDKLAVAEIRQSELGMKLQSVIEQYESERQQAFDTKLQQTSLAFKELLTRFDMMAGKKMSADDASCKELLFTFMTLNPNVYEKMRIQYPRIKSSDILICILAINGFSTSQIAVLLDYESPEIYHFMQRISKGLTGKSVGRITEFRDVVDKFIEEHVTVLAES